MLQNRPRPRPNSSIRTRANHQSDSNIDLDNAINTSHSKQNQKTSKNLPSPSSKIRKARLSTPNLTQRKPSVGKVAAQSQREKESKTTINRSFPNKDKKTIFTQAAITHSTSDKDRDLFAIAETDKVHESEYALNQAKNRAKQSQTENPQLKKAGFKANKGAVLKPATLNSKSSSLKKDQPPQPRKGLNTTVLTKPVIQRGKSITNQSPTKDLKASNVSAQRANPSSAKRATPSRQHSATNSTLASPRVLDTPIERPKAQHKASSFVVSTAIIEALSAKETTSTDYPIQKVEEQVPKPSNVSNKKRIFEIMSQACE